MAILTVQEWFRYIEDHPDDDASVIDMLFKNLGHYAPGPKRRIPDYEQCVNLFAAIRLHQLKSTR